MWQYLLIISKPVSQRYDQTPFIKTVDTKTMIKFSLVVVHTCNACAKEGRSGKVPLETSLVYKDPVPKSKMTKSRKIRSQSWISSLGHSTNKIIISFSVAIIWEGLLQKMACHYHHINFRITRAEHTKRGPEKHLCVHRNPQDRKTVHSGWERQRNPQGQCLSLAW